MRQDFFRREVLAAKQVSWLGSVSNAQPLSRRGLIGSALAVGLISFLFISLTTYAQHEHVFGQLVPNATDALRSEMNASEIGNPLAVELVIPQHLLPYVQQGNEVSWRYLATPQNPSWGGMGAVAGIDSSAVAANALKTLGVKPTHGEAVYRVYVSLLNDAGQTARNNGALKPGLKLEAVILGEKRSLLAWSVSSLFSYRVDAQRP